MAICFVQLSCLPASCEALDLPASDRGVRAARGASRLGLF